MPVNPPSIKNEFGQPIGHPLDQSQPAKMPPKTNMEGTYSILEILNPDVHAPHLFELFLQEPSGWTYLPYGPFATYHDFHAWLVSMTSANDPLLYAIINKKNGLPIGISGYLRINLENASIEIGHVHFSNSLKRTPIATEAMYLLMSRAFEELHYRRYEWKCDSLNQASRNAALRLGFKFEGIFRQDRIYKKRSRDTAWFSIIDNEWPELKSRFQRWLSPANFAADGNQIVSLSSLHHNLGVISV